MNKLLLILFSIGLVFPSKKTNIIKTVDKSSHQTRVEANVDDNVLKLTIEKNGEKNTYEVDLKNVIELNAIRDLVGDLGIDIHLDSIFKNTHNPMTFMGNTFLGVRCEDISDQLRDYFKVKSDGGILISEILKDSPAETSGLKAGDILISINNKEIWDTLELTRAVKKHEPKEEIIIKVVRKGRIKKIKVTLGERDDLFRFDFNDAFGFDHFNSKKEVKRFNKKLFDEDEDFLFDDAKLKKDLRELREEMNTLKKELKELKKKSK
jgi:predicted metalloprotease with PDZ domain